MRQSVQVIASYIKHKKVKRVALLKRMQLHLDKIVKIQAVLRGHYVRVTHSALI